MVDSQQADNSLPHRSSLPQDRSGADTGAGADAERARQLRVAEQLDGLPVQQSIVAYLRAAQRELSDSEKDDMRWAGLPEVALDSADSPLPAFDGEVGRIREALDNGGCRACSNCRVLQRAEHFDKCMWSREAGQQLFCKQCKDQLYCSQCDSFRSYRQFSKHNRRHKWNGRGCCVYLR